jgi:SRSO17 transposase
LETAPELKLNAKEIRNFTEQLQEYCAIYNPLFRRAEQREYAGDYVHGLLLNVPRKSIEPMVLTLYGADGNAVRGMQKFLGEGKWDDLVIRQRHWQEVNTTLGEDDGVFIIDGVRLSQAR